MIHESYGDDLDMTTDEEDTYHQTLFISSGKKISTNEHNQYDVSMF